MAPAATLPLGAATEEAALDFAYDLEFALNSADTAMVIEAFDQDALIDAILEGVEVSPDFLASLRLGMREGLQEAIPEFADQLLAPVAAGARYSFLRSQRHEGGNRALFRLLFAASGFNYYAWDLVSTPTGEIRAADMYVAGLGLSASEMIRSNLVTPSGDLTFDANGPTERSFEELAASSTALTEVVQSIKDQRYQDAIDRINALPLPIRDQKQFQMFKVKATMFLGGEAHERALSEARRLFGDDPTFDLMLIDSYLLQGDYNASRASIDRLDALVGGDPYLEVLRSSVASRQGDLAQAKRLCQNAIEQEPDMIQAYNMLLTVTVRGGDFDGAVEALTRMEEQFDFEVDIAALAGQPVFAEFTRSEPFQSWLASRMTAQTAHPEN